MTAAPLVLGLDLSVTHTGIAWRDRGRWTATTIKPPAGLRGSDRLHWLRANLRKLTASTPSPIALAVIEGYSYGSKGSGIYQVAEWGGVARLALRDERIPTVELTPSQLKKLATGRGVCDKAAIAAAATRRLDADPDDEHQADALWLAAAGHLLLGVQPIPALPKAQLAVLEAIALPEVA